METINEEILLQYIDGNLSPDDVTAVEQWLAASPEHAKTLEQLFFSLQVARKVQIMQTVDPEKALQRFKAKRQQQDKKAAIRRTLRTVERIAAALFLPVLVLSAYIWMQGSREEVRMLEVRTNPGVISAFRLPDGSQVWLNAGSTLKYPSEFIAGTREVQLEGQGYFEVTRNEAQPFIVKAGTDYAVEVLGTSFNVAAYEEEEWIETTLVEGSVDLHIRTAAGKEISQRLKPKERAEFKKSTNQLEISTVNTDYDTAWKDGEIVFRNHPMEQVLRILSRHYHVKFNVKNPEVLNSIITAKFKDEQLPQVMEYLRLASGIKYKILQPSIASDQTLQVPLVEISR